MVSPIAFAVSVCCCRDMRKPLLHLFELRFDDRDGAGQDDLVDGDKREGGIVGVKQDLVPLGDLGDQRLPIEMRLFHGLEDRPAAFCARRSR